MNNCVTASFGYLRGFRFDLLQRRIRHIFTFLQCKRKVAYKISKVLTAALLINSHCTHLRYWLRCRLPRTGRLDVNLFFDIAGKTGQLTNQVCERGTWLRSSIKMVKKRDSGSSGKAVASETRYLQFESCHWRTFICCQLYSCLCVQTVWFLDTFESSHRQNVNCWYLKTRITEKEASSGPIFF